MSKVDNLDDDPIVKAQEARNAAAGGGASASSAKKEEDKNAAIEAAEKETAEKLKSDDPVIKANAEKNQAAEAANGIATEEEQKLFEKHFGTKNAAEIQERLKRAEKAEALEKENETLKKSDPLAQVKDEYTKNLFLFVKNGGDRKEFEKWFPLNVEALSSLDAIIEGKFLKLSAHNKNLTKEQVSRQVRSYFKADAHEDQKEDPEFQDLQIEMEETAIEYREYLANTREKKLNDYLKADAAPINNAEVKLSAWNPVLETLKGDNKKISFKHGDETLTFEVPDAIIKEAEKEVAEFIALEELSPDVNDPESVAVIKDMFSRIVKSKTDDARTGYFLKLQDKKFKNGKYNPRINESSTNVAELEAKKKTGKHVANQIANEPY